MQWHPETYLPDMSAEAQGSVGGCVHAQRLFVFLTILQRELWSGRMELTAEALHLMAEADAQTKQCRPTGAGNLYSEALSTLRSAGLAAGGVRPQWLALRRRVTSDFCFKPSSPPLVNSYRMR